MSGNKHHLNGSNPAENGVNNSDDGQNPKKGSKGSKDKDGDDEMTVVVPPSKGSNSPSAPGKTTEADLANGPADGDAATDEAPVDPKEKAISGQYCVLLFSLSMTYARQKSKPICPCWNVQSVSSTRDSAYESFGLSLQ